MKFWKVTVYNRRKSQVESFIVQTDDAPVKIIQILSEVHPEYEKISMKSIKRPKGIKEWKTA